MKYITDNPQAVALMDSLEAIMGYGIDLEQSFEMMPDDEFRKFQQEMYSLERIKWALQYRHAVCDNYDMAMGMFFEVFGVMVMSNGGDIAPFKDQLVAAISDDEEGGPERQSYLRRYLQMIREYQNQPVIFDEFIDSAFMSL